MTIVTATEFKTNLGKYLSNINDDEIAISKNGRLVAKLVPYKEYKVDSLIGVLSDVLLPDDFDGDYRRIIGEMRCSDYEDND